MGLTLLVVFGVSVVVAVTDGEGGIKLALDSTKPKFFSSSARNSLSMGIELDSFDACDV